jgi:MYXO-CTERM domain-containing protein
LSPAVRCQRFCGALCALLAVAVGWAGQPSNAQAATIYSYAFAEGDHGWEAGFADYPVGDDLQLQSGHQAAPESMGGQPALFISGSNTADDLFMYFEKQVDGLLPDTTYNIAFDIQLGSSYPDGSVGIGGSPANSVYLKAGASAVDPSASPDDSNWLRMNIDKGNQAGGGADAIVLGDIAKPAGDFETYELIERSSPGSQFTATTDSDGSLWLLFGTDSGFEGTTTLYYTQFTAELSVVPEPGSAGLAILGAVGVCGVFGRRRRGNG